MNLEALQDEWAKDTILDDDHLDRESLRTPNLHSKYLNHLIRYKMQLTQAKSQHASIRTKKFRYYRGEMTKGELENNGWDQWQGVKPLKNEMNEFLEGDDDLLKSTMKLEYIQCVVEFLEAIMSQIKARDWQIRNAIQWKTFISGA